MEGRKGDELEPKKSPWCNPPLHGHQALQFLIHPLVQGKDFLVGEVGVGGVELLAAGLD